MEIDLATIADQLKAAANRTNGMKVTVSSTDLIVSAGGYGTGSSEGLPFAALFLQKEDMLAKAIDRLEKNSAPLGELSPIPSGTR